MRTAPGSGGDELTNLGLLVVGAMGALATCLRLAATLASAVAGVEAPRGGLVASINVLSAPSDPAAAFGTTFSPVLFWSLLAVLAIILAGTGWLVWRTVAAVQHRTRRDPRRLPGIATRRDIQQAASEKALLGRARHLRPSLTNPTGRDVGFLIGHAHGKGVWSSVEDSTLILGPPRSGKGLHLVINAILDAPGAVITTSTRPDNITATFDARRAIGPVAVFDPQGLARDIPAGLRWSPVRGCENPQTAMIRATGLASATGLSSGGVDSGSFWEGKTRTVLQSLLHAAALGERSPRDLLSWTLNPSSAAEAAGILAGHPNAAIGWKDALESIVHSDPRTRDSIWMGVSLSLACLSDPRVLDAVSPAAGQAFDPETFLLERGSLYLLATGAGAGAAWPLVAALIEDLVETARRIAATSPGARLDPPMLLALDEIGNLSPLPSLPVLMAEGGGTGITTMPVLQSLSQARSKWGIHAAQSIWESSIVKIILGGASSAADLRDLSSLLGDRDDVTVSTTRGDLGTRSAQHSTRKVPIMATEDIRRLPFGTGLVLLRNDPPMITTLRRWDRK